ncbi:MAG TPA: 2-oxoglutarate dehydrogenase E1 component, partial [Gammaproteobacteria bacterium]|nr:2-oxoglutarate dehydrogenase E1 component [Gammaproteobacteria bacterium]
MDDITRSRGLLEIWEDSQLAGHNAAYLEGLYEGFLNDPASVPEDWRIFFQTLPRVNGYGAETSHSTIRDTFRSITRQPSARLHAEPDAQVSTAHEEKQIRVLQLINAFRFRGHQIANFDPLGLREKPVLMELALEFHGLGEADLDTVFETGSLAIGEHA